jgi:hypothetical protein
MSHLTNEQRVFVDEGQTVIEAAVLLAGWYAAHPVVRRLWAIRDSRRMRVIVALEPTLDGDDIYPAWLANGGEWTRELQSLMHEPVLLDVIDEPSLGEFAAGMDGVVVAKLFWRDSSMLSDDPPAVEYESWSTSTHAPHNSQAVSTV